MQTLCIHSPACMQSQERNFLQKHKTPCNNQHTEKACLAWGMQQTDFSAFYCYQKSTNLPSRRVAEKLGMTLQETDTDPMNAFTSMYAIIKRYFLQKHKTPCCNHTAGRCLTNDTIAYRKIYFNKNSIASTYSSGFTSLPLPQTRCSRTKEIIPMEMPSEML